MASGGLRGRPGAPGSLKVTFRWSSGGLLVAPGASWGGLPFRNTSRVIFEFGWPPERLLVAFWPHLVVPGWLWKLPVASGRFPWSCGGLLVAKPEAYMGVDGP